MNTSPFELPLSFRVWSSRYRWNGSGGEGDDDIHGTWRRVATALASVERSDKSQWAERFFQLLCDFRFLPGGRILAGAGTTLPVTLFNCYVGDRPNGSLDRLLSCLDDLSRVSIGGGGVGTDFSYVPPHLAAMEAQADLLAGPLPMLPLWDAMCATVNATRTRRGALMATLRCDHPDVEAFIAAKHRAGDLSRCTLSLGISDAFMAAVEADRDWRLVIRSDQEEDDSEFTQAVNWPDRDDDGRPCRTWRRIRARHLWHAILRRNHARSEPGLLFTDTIRRLNPLSYAEEICATNPCGEVPLPKYGACDLGSLNLTRFVLAPFSPSARFDLESLLACIPDAVRLLDNVYECSAFPTPRYADGARASRRIGLGITGLADTLIMLGMRYDSHEARAFADDMMHAVCVAAYTASVSLAKEKGAFPQFSAHDHLHGEFISRLPADLRRGIATHGLRNSHLLAIAPTGSISLLANGISGGIEPLIAHEVQRMVRLQPAHSESFNIQSYSVRRYRQQFGADAKLPDYFVTAADIAPQHQIDMQAVLQRHVDNAIAKTVRLPTHCSFAQYDELLRSAHAQGLKGLCTHRVGSEVGAVATAVAETSATACNAKSDSG